MIESLLDKPAPWFSGDGPDASIAVLGQCCLIRNLADFSFPAACTEDEKSSIEGRVTGVLETEPLLAAGRYWPLSRLTRGEIHAVAERRLIPLEFARSRSHGGVYVSDDQSVGIAVNGSDHLCLTALGSGLGLNDLWGRLNAIDDALAQRLDFAFDERLGFLTSSLGHVGTGLKSSVILHLPALSTSVSAMTSLVQMARQRRQAIYGLKPVVISSAPPHGLVAKRETPLKGGKLEGLEDRSVKTAEESEAFYCDLTGALYGDVTEAEGDLFLLTNLGTLGMPEEEILFHVRHTASDIAAMEKSGREQLLVRERRQVEDRVSRALGIAGSARLLGFTEAVSLLSSLRLGLDLGLLSGFTFGDLNELLIASQSAHLRLRVGGDCDELTLNVERADLFRSRVAHDREGQ